MTIRILTEHKKGLGLGHVARCYNLARAFVSMGYSLDLFVRGDAPFYDFLNKQGAIKTQTQACHILALQWETITNPALLGSDIYIIDSYMIEDFTLFLEHAKVVVLFDDDGRHFPLLSRFVEENNTRYAKLFLLNPNGFYATQNIQDSLRQYIFSGLEYALLNPCFHNKSLIHIQEEFDFFVCLGGEDLGDKSADIFWQLQGFAKSIVVVVGANYSGSLLHSPYLCCEDFEGKKSAKPYRIYHNIKQKKMAELMAYSKCCIVSGGGIVFEALRLCQKVFAINLATNQDIQIEMLATQNLITQISLPLHESFFIEKATKNARDSKQPLQIGTHIEEFASQLIFTALNQTLQGNQKQKARNFSLDTYHAIDFCNLSHSEAMRILTYRNHPFVRKNMYGSSVIDMQTHQNFLQSLHHNETSRYFLVQNSESMPTTDGTQTYDIGVISLGRINLKHKHAYLGIYKNPLLARTEKSYGHILIQILRYIAFEEYGFCMLYLEVIASNKNAIKFYEKEGFCYLGTLPNGFRIYEDTKEIFCDVFIYGLENIL